MVAENLNLPPVIGIVGWKNSGKTTLVEALIGELTGRGWRVSTIKHAHHDFDIDIPGKDSFRHRMAGANEVLVASAQRWALLHELKSDREPVLPELLSHLGPCDLVLVEGFKTSANRKIEVRRQSGAGPLLAEGDHTICAVATDAPDLAGRHRALPLNDAAGVADFICAELGLAR